MFYLQKIHSQVSRMEKSTACLLLYLSAMFPASCDGNFFSWWKSTYQDRTTGFITYLTARTDFVGWLRDIAAQCINQDKTRAVKISHGVLLTFYILNHILFVLPGKLLKNIKIFQLVPQPKLGQHHYKKVTDLYSNWNRLAVAETKTFPPEDLLSRCLDPNSSWACIPISNAFSAGIWDA